MNAEHLLTHFDRLADAPDTVPRLRRFILDLAVRGKLVEQDPNDEPAGELLKRIAAEKKRRVEAGEIKKTKPTTDLTSSIPGLDVTSGWVITSLQSVCASITDGDHLPPPKTENGIPFLVIGNVRSQTINFAGSRFVSPEYYEALDPIRRPRSGDLLYTLVGSYGIPVVVRDEQPFCVQRHIGILRPSKLIDVGFLARVMESRLVFEQATACATGIAQKTIPLSGLRRLLIPLPPLAEQRRIVAKVDELMALCDRLETARKEREATCDRLTAASLARLNTPDPDPAVFQNHATFALNNLTPLTTRSDQIKALRQTILNLAVRGKLVEQDPKDEPVGELLKRIVMEKRRLVEAGEIRQLRVLSSTDESPFDIPPSWEWKALGEIVHLENGDRSKNYPSGSDIKTVGVPFFNTKNISDYAVKFDQLDFITEEKFKSLRSGKMKDLDILITLRGSVGKLGLFQATKKFTTGFINAQLLIVRNFERRLVHFCLTFMKSQVFLNQIFARSSGSATPQLSASQLAEVLIPLPPLAEQDRIVTKVDELMAVCDRLEASLARGEETRGRLVEAVLYETLAPGLH